MEQLIYEVNGIKYLLFSAVLTKESQILTFTKKVQRYSGILQSYEVVDSFWNGKEANVKVLIPEYLAVLFSDSKGSN